MQAGWFRLLQDYASSWNRSIVKGKGEDILKFFLTKDAGKKEVDRLNRLQEGYRERDATPKKSETQVQNIHLVGEEVDRVKAHVEVYQRQIYQQKQALFDQEEKIG